MRFGIKSQRYLNSLIAIYKRTKNEFTGGVVRLYDMDGKEIKGGGYKPQKIEEDSLEFVFTFSGTPKNNRPIFKACIVKRGKICLSNAFGGGLNFTNGDSLRVFFNDQKYLAYKAIKQYIHDEATRMEKKHWEKLKKEIR